MNRSVAVAVAAPTVWTELELAEVPEAEVAEAWTANWVELGQSHNR